MNYNERIKARYKDIDMKFSRHPVTKDISVRTGVWAVLQSVRNIVMTSLEEWETMPEMGAGMYRTLGENIAPTYQVDVESKITAALKEFEPRVEVTEVSCMVGSDNPNAVQVKIYFYIINEPDIIEETFWLKRVN